jgi:diacylglycerol kinase family enzyme
MEYIESIKRLVERCLLFTGKSIHVTVIANPVAGGFTIKKRARANEAFFAAALAESEKRSIAAKSVSAVMHLTAAAGHAKLLAEAVLKKALSDKDPDSKYFVITAGGDGTSLDVQTVFARAVLDEGHKELIDKVYLLRLPFGTGNDGSDGRTLDVSLSLLAGNAHFDRQCAVRVRTARGRSWYAFNIASIGIDAFITHMTNKVKNRLPGDFYKLWVDLACVFYNFRFRVDEMKVAAYRNDGSIVLEHRDRMVLYLMGASGHRTYGSNQKILPGNEDVCGVREMPFLRKLALKKHFRLGTHASFPETMLYKADRLVIDYGEEILVQLDGEAHLLEPSDFPLTMERTEGFITIVKADA